MIKTLKKRQKVDAKLALKLNLDMQYALDNQVFVFTREDLVELCDGTLVFKDELTIALSQDRAKLAALIEGGE